MTLIIIDKTIKSIYIIVKNTIAFQCIYIIQLILLLSNKFKQIFQVSFRNLIKIM